MLRDTRLATVMIPLPMGTPITTRRHATVAEKVTGAMSEIMQGHAVAAETETGTGAMSEIMQGRAVAAETGKGTGNQSMWRDAAIIEFGTLFLLSGDV